MALAPCVALERVGGGGGVSLSEGERGSFMSPSNHQALNSTIRSCYFVAGLWQGGKRAARLAPLALKWRAGG